MVLLNSTYAPACEYCLGDQTINIISTRQSRAGIIAAVINYKMTTGLNMHVMRSIPEEQTGVNSAGQCSSVLKLTP